MRAISRAGLATRWLVVALYVNALFWSIPYVRPLSNAVLRAGHSRWWFGAAGIVFAVLVVVRALQVARPRTIVTGLVAYAVLIAWLRAIPIEVIHIAEYGVLALLARFAIEPSAPAAASSRAIFLTSVLGFVDEVTQGATPGRFFDWRDVAVNVIAAAIPVWMLMQTNQPAEEP